MDGQFHLGAVTLQKEVLIGNWMNGSGVKIGSEPGIKDE